MTSQQPQAWVVIAAYNEAPVIASVVADVKRAGYRALAVDDGSTDATGAVAAEAGCSWGGGCVSTDTQNSSHRPRCRPHYLYLDRDQSAPSTQSPPQAARAHGADHRTGEGTCHRERPLASIDIMSPRAARRPWRSVDSSGLSMSRRRYSRATDHRPWSEGGRDFEARYFMIG